MISARNTVIAYQHAQGKSYATLAQAFGLSTTRIGDIVHRVDRLEHKPGILALRRMDLEEIWPDDVPYPTHALSTRALYAFVLLVHRNQVTTIAEAYALVQGPYRPNPMLRNCGKKVRAELRTWLEEHMTTDDLREASCQFAGASHQD